jgi:hypothetical protein
MTKIMSVMLVLLASALPAAAQKVYVDYDRTVDFSSFKTFAWAQTPPTPFEMNYPMGYSFIKNSIEYELTGAGLTEDTADPDLYVTFFTASKESFQVMVTAFGYSYGPGWGWDPYWGTTAGAASAQVNTYKKGSLVIDIWDARTKRAVWRGTAEKVISENPEKALRQVDAAITKIVEKYQSMRAKEK